VGEKKKVEKPWKDILQEEEEFEFCGGECCRNVRIGHISKLAKKGGADGVMKKKSVTRGLHAVWTEGGKTTQKSTIEKSVDPGGDQGNCLNPFLAGKVRKRKGKMGVRLVQ